MYMYVIYFSMTSCTFVGYNAVHVVLCYHRQCSDLTPCLFQSLRRRSLDLSPPPLLPPPPPVFTIRSILIDCTQSQAVLLGPPPASCRHRLTIRRLKGSRSRQFHHPNRPLRLDPRLRNLPSPRYKNLPHHLPDLTPHLPNPLQLLVNLTRPPMLPGRQKRPLISKS